MVITLSKSLEIARERGYTVDVKTTAYLQAKVAQPAITSAFKVTIQDQFCSKAFPIKKKKKKKKKKMKKHKKKIKKNL